MLDSQHPSARLAPTVERLNLERLRRHLTTEVVGHHIYIFETVDSTNCVLARLADLGAAEGTVVFAAAQTAGRGRHGSAWYSPDAANLYASVLFRPRIVPRELPMFAPIASLALAETVWLEGVPARIRWPGDVLVGGRKLGGVLVQAPILGHRLAHVILGLGVNLNVQPAELTDGLGEAAEAAVSLRELLGREVDCNAFAATLLNRLEKWHLTFLTRGPDAVRATWQARDALRGRRLEARTGDAVCQGWGRGIDADGSLLVEDESGRTRHIVAGAVRVLDRQPEMDG